MYTRVIALILMALAWYVWTQYPVVNASPSHFTVGINGAAMSDINRRPHFTNYLDPVVRTQPDTPICPVCLLSADAVLTIHLASDLPGALSHPTLHIFTTRELKVSYPLDINESELVAEAKFDITDLDIDMKTVLTAEIAFVVDDEYVSIDPVLLP
ncbi:MAG: hypothetical protein ETSY1_13960 [Candidatus Entotheonella factor]|uniref:Uncharacterized protein n=1 Tax=Entotheonella factor TaxID=1429438 RepID=W4LNR4_ENTF1|nr:MAG: hypothetical protein ETSY1_13960 [Candidatus Entotheonella factor]